MHFHYVSMHVYTQDHLLSQNLDKIKIKQLILSNPTYPGKEIFCIDKWGDGVYSIKHIGKWSNRNENQFQITQRNGLNRLWIMQDVLYLFSNLWPIGSNIMSCVIWFIKVQHEEVRTVNLRQTQPVQYRVHPLLVRNLPNNPNKQAYS